MRTTTLGIAAVFTTLLTVVTGRPHELRGAKILQRADEVAEEYDYVIVGAGTAGLTVADRLTADGKTTVLVIEYCHVISDEVTRAGGGRSFNDPGIRYNITSVEQPDMHNRTQAVRIGCCVGGSSAINGMVAVRGTRSEYDGWAELGGPDSTWDWDGAFNITWDPDAWGMEEDTHIYASFPTYQNPSISKSPSLPGPNPLPKRYCARATNSPSQTVPMYQAMAKMPRMDVPLDGANGNNGLFWFPSSLDPNTYWRSYARTGHYDGLVDERDNLHVITRHKVRRVLFDDDLAATGVEFFSRDADAPEEEEEEEPAAGPATQIVRARKEVILSAGTVHTPQILQLSGIGPKDLLESAGIDVLVDMPGVGQNFQDHAYLSVGYRWNNGAPPAPNDFEEIAARYEAQDPADFLPADSHPWVVAGYADFQKLHAKLLRSKNTNILWYPVGGSPGGIVMSMHIVSHGTINIDPASPESEPIVDYRALSNPVDLDIMVENIRFLRKYMASEDFAEYEPEETMPGIDVEGEELEEWIREPKEKGGVVDEELLVHDVKNLRVVDGSIMPLLPGANTQQPVYMLAEKAVDLIKARNGGSPEAEEPTEEPIEEPEEPAEEPAEDPEEPVEEDPEEEEPEEDE
ncbi:unnamed protein product [Parascedosporium putredinis]|uniref:Glucose-methanol-choline oxidoreductase N-terminal domain-containing protein n=1 Tax=Parascedosporium putredinis TaxID=1442378 RepID=A0A9P1M6B6_9PEZI|nr:unnamed protein product [Parascedosporium putredinis]CAI7989391.1 unnamed protein product [Parascedosporium putredinis]